MKYSIEKRFGLVAAGSLGALLAACSSGSTNVVGAPVNCGAGTTLVGSLCVAEGADSSAAGADAAGMGDAGEVDTSTGDARAGDADAMAGGDGDAAPLVADPCPDGGVAVNCDQTCDLGTTAWSSCSKVDCGEDFTGDQDTRISTFTAPVILRTPSQPMTATNCYSSCMPAPAGVEPSVYAMTFRVAMPVNNQYSLEVRVGAPWIIDEIVTDGDTCPYDSPQGARAVGCVSSPTTAPAVFMVWTDDANAVARDIQVAQVTTSTACQ